jgi:hypothetical protein
VTRDPGRPERLGFINEHDPMLVADTGLGVLTEVVRRARLLGLQASDLLTDDGADRASSPPPRATSMEKFAQAISRGGQ